METDGEGDLGHGEFAFAQTLAGGDDAVTQQVFTKRDAVNRMKTSAELKTAEPAMGGDPARCELLVVVIADELDGVSTPW